MLRPRVATGTAEGDHGERHLRLATRQVADLGGVVDQLVEADRDEVGERDLDDRPGAGERRAHGGAHEAELAGRGVAHALDPELFLQAPALRVDAAGLADVLAHEEDARVALQLAAQRLADRGVVLHAAPPRPSVE